MKTMLITGGSHGLGKAIAAHYAKTYTVIILSSTQAKLEAAAKAIDCEWALCDVSDWSSIEKTVNDILTRRPQIDVLINNAGLHTGDKVEDIDPIEAENVFKVNALGPLFMAKAVIPGMKQHKSGHIININSQGGLLAKSERTVYRGSKWALTGITKCLQLELAPFGIQVAGLYPGALEQRMEGDGQPTAQSKSVSYQEVVEGVNFILTRQSSTVVTELGLRHLENE
jgi:NAD(P)-dependent dehydrogenase (short-subunit alcohol dehydrogenase family)